MHDLTFVDTMTTLVPYSFVDRRQKISDAGAVRDSHIDVNYVSRQLTSV